jgi:hypothetical protein
MAENKNAKTSADGGTGFIDGVWYGPWYGTAPTCISSKPPKREWVWLTDEEIQDLSYLSQKIDESNSPWFDRCGFARAVESKLREKNRG